MNEHRRADDAGFRAVRRVPRPKHPPEAGDLAVKSAKTGGENHPSEKDFPQIGRLLSAELVSLRTHPALQNQNPTS